MKQPSSLTGCEPPELVTHEIALTLLYTPVPLSGSNHPIVYASECLLCHYVLLHFCGEEGGYNDYCKDLNHIFLACYENSVLGPPKANEQEINGVSGG